VPDIATMTDSNQTSEQPKPDRPAPETFHHCPNCAMPAKKIGANPFKCDSPDCEFCFYFSPTAAVGAIIVNPENEILFLIRGRDPVQREVLEEASLEVIGIESLCSFPNSYSFRGVTVDVIDAFFVCEVATFDDLAPQAGEVEGFLISKPTPEVLENLAFESNRLAVGQFVKQKL